MTDSQLWIIVKRWGDHQHYKNRNPPWIKNKTELLHKENYLELPAATRGLLHGLWMEYASSHGEVRLSTRALSYRLRMRVTKQQLDSLKHNGFIEYALAPRLQDASPSRAREETETYKEETETEQPPTEIQPELSYDANGSDSGSGDLRTLEELLATHIDLGEP